MCPFTTIELNGHPDHPFTTIELNGHPDHPFPLVSLVLFRASREWIYLLLDNRLLPNDGEGGQEQTPI